MHKTQPSSTVLNQTIREMVFGVEVIEVESALVSSSIWMFELYLSVYHFENKYILYSTLNKHSNLYLSVSKGGGCPFPYFFAIDPLFMVKKKCTP